MRQVVVLCGGAGTRLRQITRGSQKCMVEVAGAPFLAHVLGVVDQWKPDEVLLLVSHHAEQVIAFAASSERRQGQWALCALQEVCLPRSFCSSSVTSCPRKSVVSGSAWYRWHSAPALRRS